MAEVGSLGYHEPVRHVPGELTVQNHFTLVVLRTVTLALDRRRLHHRRRYARGVPGYSERHFVPKPFPGGAWEGSKNQGAGQIRTAEWRFCSSLQRFQSFVDLRKR